MDIEKKQVKRRDFLGGLGIPLPDPFRAAGEFVLNENLRRAIAASELDLGLIRSRAEPDGGHASCSAPRRSYAHFTQIRRASNGAQ